MEKNQSFNLAPHSNSVVIDIFSVSAPNIKKKTWELSPWHICNLKKIVGDKE